MSHYWHFGYLRLMAGSPFFPWLLSGTEGSEAPAAGSSQRCFIGWPRPQYLHEGDEVPGSRRENQANSAVDGCFGRLDLGRRADAGACGYSSGL